jgi:UDP-glucose 4-epimerase
VVLGGTGFVGAHIGCALVAAGDDVVAVGRTPPSAGRAERLSGAIIRSGDVSDPSVLQSVLDGADLVVYAVGCPYPAESNLDPVGDVEQTLPIVLRVLQAMRSHPGCRFVFVSSGGTVYGNPRSIPVGEEAQCEPLTSYGIMKLAAERYVHMYSALYGFDGHVVRIANAYGPTQATGRGQGVVAAFLAAASSGEAVRIYGDGSIIRDYLHVADAAHAIAALSRLDEMPRTCNIGSGNGHSILDVLHAVESVTGRQLEVRRLPDRGFDVRAIVLDVSRLAGIVDWHPRGLVDGIADTWPQRLLASPDALDRLRPDQHGVWGDHDRVALPSSMGRGQKG